MKGMLSHLLSWREEDDLLDKVPTRHLWDINTNDNNGHGIILGNIVSTAYISFSLVCFASSNYRTIHLGDSILKKVYLSRHILFFTGEERYDTKRTYNTDSLSETDVIIHPFL